MESGADVAPGAWLDVLPIASNCVLGNEAVISSLRYMSGLLPVAKQDKSLVCECGKSLSAGQAT